MGKGRHKPRTFEGEGGHVVAGDHHEPPSEPDHFPDGTDDLAVIDPTATMLWESWETDPASAPSCRPKPWTSPTPEPPAR